MSVECSSCHGKGFIVKGEQTCPSCNGAGKVKSMNLVGMSEKDLKSLLSGGYCPKCKGSGKIQIREKCQECGGSGKTPTCEICGKPVPAGQELCSACKSVFPVYRLTAACDVSDLDPGKVYLGKVANLADFGVFVTLNDQTKGLIHSSNVNKPYVPGEEVMVKVNTIKPNGNFDLIPQRVKEFKLIYVEKNLPRKKSSEVA